MISTSGALLLAVLLFAILTQANVLRFSAEEIKPAKANDVACCEDSCKTAICVPPWVSICFGCAKAEFEKIEINHEPAVQQPQTPVASVVDPPKKDCCDNKCEIAVCVPPFAYVCAKCDGKHGAVAIPEPPVSKPVETVDVPYKDCCKTTCKTQICVPPFVAVCLSCDDEAKVENA